MTYIKSISIPQPCRQSREQMKVAEKGRYCKHCNKIVIDFFLFLQSQIMLATSALTRRAAVGLK
jgi:hypothetical protein